MQQPLCNRKTLNEIELEIGNSRLDSLAWLLRFFLSPSFSFPRQFFNLPLCEQMRTTCEAYLSHDSSQNPLFCGSSACCKNRSQFSIIWIFNDENWSSSSFPSPRISMHSIKSGRKMGKRRRWTSAGKLSEIQFGERRHFDLSTLRLLAHH